MVEQEAQAQNPEVRARCLSCGEIPEPGFSIIDEEGSYFCDDCYTP